MKKLIFTLCIFVPRLLAFSSFDNLVNFVKEVNFRQVKHELEGDVLLDTRDKRQLLNIIEEIISKEPAYKQWHENYKDLARVGISAPLAFFALGRVSRGSIFVSGIIALVSLYQLGKGLSGLVASPDKRYKEALAIKSLIEVS